MVKILLCFGTRPEAIKMAPVFHALKATEIDVKVCITAQHREMLDQVLDFFEIIPDYDLNLMTPNQTLNQLSCKIVASMDTVLLEYQPQMVLVHGDTTTSSMVALAAFHNRIKVGHVEAGLRTYNKISPFPEEINRQITGRIADFHFAPTTQAIQNLEDEKVNPKTIFHTGNTVVDALLWGKNKIENNQIDSIEELKQKIDTTKKIILITGHRRENFGHAFQDFCEALLEISKNSDVLLVYPVHLNPNVQEPVKKILSNKENILLINPVSYPEMIWLMQQAKLIISDSGGIQEEAPTFGKFVLVTRETTERMEGVDQGFAVLVGTNKEKIVLEVNNFLKRNSNFEHKSNPYGDGKAAQKIVEIIQSLT